ncbi:Arabinan endo-1,5-alpha-L-arabinosidase [Minicystis rosea]|nr:Arabinan endo-1,5-alpha-L-arabinosidase [Minicystis rosea]
MQWMDERRATPITRALAMATWAGVALGLAACSLKDLSYLQAGLGDGGGSGSSSSTGSSTSTSSSSSSGGGSGGGGGDAGTVDLAKGLYAHYTFDETSGDVAKDTSGNGLDGAVMGGSWVEGKLGGALSLSGQESYVQLPAGLLVPLQEVTVAFWINWSGGALWQRIFDFGQGSPRGCT